jgi:hypothetical protein
MLLNKAYYTFKFLVPRRLQIELRRYYVNRKRSLHAEKWPIDPIDSVFEKHWHKYLTGLTEKQKEHLRKRLNSSPQFDYGKVLS